MVHGEDGQLFAGLDVDEFEFAADDGSTGVLAHTESRGSAASHIDLCDGEHEFIFRLGGIDPDTVRFEVVVFRLGVLFPYDRGYGDEDTVFVFLVKALASRVFLPSGTVDDEALEFGPIFDPIGALRFVILVHSAVCLVHFVTTVELDHLGFGPIDFYLGILSGLVEYAEATGLQFDFRKEEGAEGHENGNK